MKILLFHSSSTSAQVCFYNTSGRLICGTGRFARVEVLLSLIICSIIVIPLLVRIAKYIVERLTRTFKVFYWKG